MSNSLSMLGDALPAALGAYYSSLDDGRFEAAADAFTPDAHYAVPLAGPETQPRVETTGRDAILRRFEARGAQPYRHVVDLCTVDGDECLVEGVTVAANGAKSLSFVASATLRDGLIARYLAFACTGARDPVPTDVPIDAAPADADAVLHRYFDALDRGDFEAAADCFSSDVLYSHPPYRHTAIDSDRRVEFRGRDELRAAFAARGRQTFGHRILTGIQRGPHAIVEGAVFDLPDGGSGSFISSLSLDAAGSIRRYVSFYCEPVVSR